MAIDFNPAQHSGVCFADAIERTVVDGAGDRDGRQLITAQRLLDMRRLLQIDPGFGVYVALFVLGIVQEHHSGALLGKWAKRSIQFANQLPDGSIRGDAFAQRNDPLSRQILQDYIVGHTTFQVYEVK
jgi:hypothetical protein